MIAYSEEYLQLVKKEFQKDNKYVHLPINAPKTKRIHDNIHISIAVRPCLLDLKPISFSYN